MPVDKPDVVIYAPAKFKSQPWGEPDAWFDDSGTKMVVLPYVPRRENSFEAILATRISGNIREFNVRRGDTQETEWVQIIHLLIDQQFDMLEDWLDTHPHIRKRMEEPFNLYGYDKHLEVLREYERRMSQNGQERKKGEEEKCGFKAVETPKVAHLLAPEREDDALEPPEGEPEPVQRTITIATTGTITTNSGTITINGGTTTITIQPQPLLLNTSVVKAPTSVAITTPAKKEHVHTHAAGVDVPVSAKAAPTTASSATEERARGVEGLSA